MTDWTEIADRVYVLRYPVLDVNSTLVIGDGESLLVDTFASARQAAELADAVRQVTSSAPALVNTHHHFDHSFGNATLASGRPVWAHPRCIDMLAKHGEQLRHAAAEECPELAAELADVTISPPDTPVADHMAFDLGGRRIILRYCGRAHTDNDLAVVIPDAGVTVAGDLVESGAPPAFGDSWPLEWPATLAALLDVAKAEAGGVLFVPGHGAPIDDAFVREQHAQLTALEWLCREGHADTAPVEEIAARSPFGVTASLPAVRRAYAALDGHLQ